MKFASLAGKIRSPGSFGLSVEWKSLFFDRESVSNPVLEESRQALLRLGAYTRRVARSSIKVKGAARKAPKIGTKAYDKWLEQQRNKPRSAPGSAPFQHTSNAVVYPRNIWFAKDGDNSVVIGMAAFGRKSTPTPAAIEFGESKRIRNSRRVLRKIGGSGEIRTDGRFSKTNKTAAKTRKGSVAVTYAKLKTQAQVDRANQINAELYGDDVFLSITTAERPVMGPALSKAAVKFDEAFEGRLSS